MNTGKFNHIEREVKEKVDITEELIKVKDPMFNLFSLDDYLREMFITDTHLFFGLSRNLLRMDRKTYKIELLFIGTGVLHDVCFLNNRFYLNQAFADTYSFATKGITELEIDTYFNDMPDFKKF